MAEDSSAPPVSSSDAEILQSRRRRRRAKRIGDGKKRWLTDEQGRSLERHFEMDQRLKKERKLHLAGELGLEPIQIAVWFQNRRARWKNRQVEEEYVKLKAVHRHVGEKCRLENEVLKLKERLSEAEEEVKKLSGELNGTFNWCLEYMQEKSFEQLLNVDVLHLRSDSKFSLA